MNVALGPGDLVLCSGSLSRDVTFGDRVTAAVAGGFAGISLWGRDYVRAVLADNGLSVAEIDPVWWWPPGGAEVVVPHELDTQNVFGFGEIELFAVADALGARSVNAVDVFGGPWSLDQAAGAFADLCDRAGEHGLLVHLEFLPWSRIPDLAAACPVCLTTSRAPRCSGSSSTTHRPPPRPTFSRRHSTTASCRATANWTSVHCSRG